MSKIQFTLKASTVKSIVTSVKLIIPKRPLDAVLGYIKLASIDNQIKVTSTDLSTWIDMLVEAETIQNFNSVLLNFKQLESLSKLLKVNKKKDSLIVFKFSDQTNNCNVIDEGGINYNIDIRDYNEFPELPNAKLDKSILVDSNTLKLIYDKVGFASSTEETKQVLTGIHINQRGDILNAVATDGYRLARLNIENKNILGDDLECTIQAATVFLATKLMKGLVKVGYTDDNYAIFEDSRTKITGRLLEGEYPKCDLLIPNHLESDRINIKFNLLDVVNVMSSMKKNTTVSIDVDSNNNARFNFSSNIKGADNNVFYYVDILCECIKEYQVAFNASYVKDAINSIDGEYITFSCHESKKLSSVLIVEKAHTNLLMPLNIR